MASTKFYGSVGYATSVESSPGVYEDVIVERRYYCNIIRNTRRLEPGDGLNDNVRVSNSISIVADPYAGENFFAMRYIRWAGVLWKISDVEVQSPRLILTLGEVYNGPIAVT